MEYGGEKSLNDLIEKRKEDGLEAFPAADIEKVALHVARGLQVRHESWLVHWRVKAAGSTKSALCLLLQYLHNEKRLLHGDMKSCNVVVKGDFESIKICDVGVSLQLDENMKGEGSGVQAVSLAA